MATKAEQITAAIYALLSEPTAVVVDATWRSRLKRIPQNIDRAVVVRKGLDRKENLTTLGRHHRIVSQSVEVYVRGDEPDLLADPIVKTVVNRVLSDRTLSGLCDDIQVDSVSPEWESADTDLVVMEIAFSVLYESSDNAL